MTNLATLEKKKWKAKQNNKLVLGEKAKIRDDQKQCKLFSEIIEKE